MQADLSKNYFELFGLPIAYDLDPTELTSRYRELQRRFHPDKFSNASNQEKRLSLQFTAQINEALRVLKDPVQRGRYMLKLAGVDTDEETDTRMDSEFLMKQIELREELAEVRGHENPHKRVAELVNDIEQTRRNHIATLERCLSEQNDEAYAEARNILRELQFLEKILSEIEILEDEVL